MKKLFPLLFLLILPTYKVFSQSITIDSFYQPGTKWTEYLFNNFGGDGFLGCQFKVEKDSIIKGLKYHLISECSIGGCTVFWHPFPIVTCAHYPGDYHDSLIAGIRTVYKKVYELNLANDSETLIYDFDLHVGDTLKFKPYNNVVKSIDSVKITGGIYLKRYKFDYIDNFTEDYWLEGIGSRLGILNSLTSDSQPEPLLTSHALCYDAKFISYQFPDSVLIPYAPNLDTNCFDISTTGIQKVSNESKDVTIYPDPVTGNYLHIKSDNFQDVESIFIYNTTGEIVDHFYGPFINNTDNSFNVNLSPGVYMIKITYKIKGYIMKKIVKT